MRERELRRLLLLLQAPSEADAQRRAWQVVRAGFAEREPVRWPRRHARPLLVLAASVAVLAATLAAVLTTPGQAVMSTIRKAIAEERVVGVRGAKPALVRLPAAGRLLVESARGPAIVHADGSVRRLGAYAGASWSPRGIHVVVTRGHQLVALRASSGQVRWIKARPGRVNGARWSTSPGHRVAYLEGRDVRVIVGNGTRDRLLARSARSVAPAWRPGRGHVLAYVASSGRILVRNADSGALLWRSRRLGSPRGLLWSSDGSRLLTVRARGFDVFDPGGRRIATMNVSGRVVAAAFAPRGHRFAFTRTMLGRSEVALLDADQPRERARSIFAGAGLFSDLTWSPDGRWLLVGWRSADQWLFIRSVGVRRIVAYSGMSRQFDPGARRARGFPRVAWDAWCCR